MKNIYLIGMPGCGKSTLGKLLSKKINKKFVDLDKYIEYEEKKSIKELFLNGEEFFRDKEEYYLKRISNEDGVVIATGGGVIKRKSNIEIMKTTGIILFINSRIDTIWSRLKEDDTRPLIKQGYASLQNLYNDRIELYEKYCDYNIENNGTIENGVEFLYEVLSDKWS